MKELEYALSQEREALRSRHGGVDGVITIYHRQGGRREALYRIMPISSRRIFKPGWDLLHTFKPLAAVNLKTLQ